MGYPIDGGNLEINPGKNFSRAVNFVEVGHVPVYVSGLDEEILGAGRIIGLIHLNKEGSDRISRKVIAIEDPKSPDGEVEIFDSECTYQRMANVDLDIAVAQSNKIMSAVDYVLSFTNSAVELPNRKTK